MSEHRVSEHLARWRKGVALAALSMMVTASLVMPVQSAEESEPELKDLKGVEELKALFNADNGSPRLFMRAQCAHIVR